MKINDIVAVTEQAQKSLGIREDDYIIIDIVAGMDYPYVIKELGDESDNPTKWYLKEDELIVL